MSIRLRKVNGKLIALCAARSVVKPGDVYLDDGAHHALAEKFALDWNEEGMPWRNIDQDMAELVEKEESNNPARTEWDQLYDPEGIR